MRENGFTHCEGQTHNGWSFAWSLLNWDLVIPARFTNEFVNIAG